MTLCPRAPVQVVLQLCQTSDSIPELRRCRLPLLGDLSPEARLSIPEFGEVHRARYAGRTYTFGRERESFCAGAAPQCLSCGWSGYSDDDLASLTKSGVALAVAASPGSLAGGGSCGGPSYLPQAAGAAVPTDGCQQG